MEVLRYYVRYTTVPFEEDLNHEFKGHTNLCDEDMHPGLVGTDSRPTRHRISKILNAFLNSGNGGTVYLGILDDGRVTGISLTQYQKDHFVLALEDLFSRFQPEVKKCCYELRFVPIVEADMTEEERSKVVKFNQTAIYEDSKRDAEHQLRTFTYCWCKKEARNRFQSGVIVPSYVIEIEIKAFDRKAMSDMSIGQSQLHPVYQDETGKMFIRYSACVRQLTFQDLYTQTQQDVREITAFKTDQLLAERARLREQVAALSLKKSSS